MDSLGIKVEVPNKDDIELEEKKPEPPKEEKVEKDDEEGLDMGMERPKEDIEDEDSQA
jgi:hypothetical protein